MKLVPLFPDPNAAPTSRRRGRWLLVGTAGLGLPALAAGGLLLQRHDWPQAKILAGSSSLARVQVASYGESVASVEAVDASGERVPVSFAAGLIEPEGTLPPASKVSVTVTVHRSRWVGWLVGHTERIELVVRTPATYVAGRLVDAKAGDPVQVRFSAPVKVVSVQRLDGTTSQLTLARARRLVSLGITDSGEDTAGTVLVSGVPRLWESQPSPVKINWFPASRRPQVIVRPAPRSTIVPSAPIVLTFSRPVRQILGSTRPQLRPRVKGVWTQPNDDTLVFTPSGLGFPLGRRVHLRLPEAIDVISGADPSPFRILSWQVPRASLLRIKQLLAQQGYLPVTWSPAGKAVRLTPGAQSRAGVDPPSGSFSFAYPKTPMPLETMWKSSNERPTLVRGAIMSFEDTHGMPADGFPSMAVFRALVRDQLAGKAARHSYSYVFVTESLPETLTLWHAGHVILRAAVNTGISSRPTDLGTYPVYAHLVSTTMQGTNPDGTHYNDPGVPWVNYFNGGDAVHGFVRGSYGWPQSLGCVEAPITTAGRIFPYVHVGTLVTVAAET
jgi:hypothetical protein